MGKLCPIMSFRKDYVGKIECYEKCCGWWNDADKCCSMVTLSNSAINVAEMAVGHRIIYTKEV